MKKLSYLLTLLTLVLVSCGTGSDHFKISGHFLNLNQGEFYVYSTDGGVEGIDTIKVEGGRFSYEIPCIKPSTLMLVFPNFSEQPIFAEPGQSVEIKADASHLKEMKVEGTKDNELMNDFREMTQNSSPPQTKKLAQQFITDHADTPVSVYLVYKYFIQSPTPDYATASKLMAMMRKEQPDNSSLARLATAAETYKKAAVGSTLQHFNAADINGNSVSSGNLNRGTAVISVWATWSYDSQNMQRMLKRMKRQKGDRLRLLSICLDASVNDCRQAMKRDTVTWTNVCDGKMFEGKLFRQLGMGYVPDNLLLRDGKIIARRLSVDELESRLKGI